MNKFFLKGTVLEDELVHTEDVTSVKWGSWGSWRGELKAKEF